jgi:hypothetical protein
MAHDPEQQPSELSFSEGEMRRKEVRDVPFRRSPNFLNLYADIVSFATSPWDFSLTFGLTVSDDPNDPHIENQVSIKLSPQTAKAMAAFLVRNIQNYERQFGEIRYAPLQQSSEGPSA